MGPRAIQGRLPARHPAVAGKVPAPRQVHRLFRAPPGHCHRRRCLRDGCAVEPAGLSKLVRDLGACYTACTYKETDILPLESEQRAKLKWGLYNRDIVAKLKDRRPA